MGVSSANAINDAGQIAVDNDFGDRGYIYDHGTYTLLQPPGRAMQLEAITTEGRIAGAAATNDPNHPVRAFYWQNGVVTTLGAINNAYRSHAYDMNDSGQVVGWSDSVGYGTSRAVLWQNSEMTDLGALPGDGEAAATAINSSGTIVGFSISDGYTNWRGWAMRNGQMIDLTQYFPPGWTLVTPWDISEQGVISGIAGTQGGSGRGFVLVPDGVRWGPVPEPGSALAMFAGLVYQCMRASKRRGKKK